jgi:predicted PurR-regulated permease PerM
MLFQEISFVLLFICSVSLVMIVGLVMLIGMVVIRLLNVFAEVNTASQAMRQDINKLLRKALNLSELEKQAFTQFQEDSRKP